MNPTENPEKRQEVKSPADPEPTGGEPICCMATPLFFWHHVYMSHSRAHAPPPCCDDPDIAPPDHSTEKN